MLRCSVWGVWYSVSACTCSSTSTAAGFKTAYHSRPLTVFPPILKTAWDPFGFPPKAAYCRSSNSEATTVTSALASLKTPKPRREKEHEAIRPLEDPSNRAPLFDSPLRTTAGGVVRGGSVVQKVRDFEPITRCELTAEESIVMSFQGSKSSLSIGYCTRARSMHLCDRSKLRVKTAF